MTQKSLDRHERWAEKRCFHRFPQKYGKKVQPFFLQQNLLTSVCCWNYLQPFIEHLPNFLKQHISFGVDFWRRCFLENTGFVRPVGSSSRRDEFKHFNKSNHCISDPTTPFIAYLNCSDQFPPVGNFPKWWWKVRESPQNAQDIQVLGFIVICSEQHHTRQEKKSNQSIYYIPLPINKNILTKSNSPLRII